MKQALLALIALFVSATLPAEAQTIRVGVINMQKISEQYQRYSQAAGQLEARKQELQKVVDQEEQSVMSMIETLEAVRATATAAEVENRRAEIEARDRELREFVMSTNMQFRQDLEGLEMRTRDEVETTVRAISREMGLSLVLEQSLMLYFNETLEITDKVVAELNRRYKPEPLQMKSAGSTVPPRSPRPAAATKSQGSGAGTSPNAFPQGTAETTGRWPFR